MFYGLGPKVHINENVHVKIPNLYRRDHVFMFVDYFSQFSQSGDLVFTFLSTFVYSFVVLFLLRLYQGSINCNMKVHLYNSMG